MRKQIVLSGEAFRKLITGRFKVPDDSLLNDDCIIQDIEYLPGQNAVTIHVQVEGEDPRELEFSETAEVYTIDNLEQPSNVIVAFGSNPAG